MPVGFRYGSADTEMVEYSGQFFGGDFFSQFTLKFGGISTEAAAYVFYLPDPQSPPLDGRLFKDE